MPRDMFHETKEAQVVAPASHAAAFYSDPVDLQNFEACQFIIHVGAYTSGSFTVTVEDSEQPASGFTAAPADVVLPQPADPVHGDPASLALDSSAANKVFALGYLPYSDKRYARLKFAGTATMIVGAVAVLGCPRYAPTR